MLLEEAAAKAVVGKAVNTAVDLAKDEKVRKEASGFLGKLIPYFGLEKEALDTYIEEIKKSDLSPDIKARLILTAKSDLKKWKNQESIAEIAFKNAKEGTDFSEKSGVDEEWFERYMDAAKFVSSEEMQLIWGKILAGEFEKPGSTPPNMIRILSEITPELAQAFQKICSMKVSICPIKELNEMEAKIEVRDTREVIVIPYSKELEKLDLTLSLFNELDALGVLKYSWDDYGFKTSSSKMVLYVEDELEIINFSIEGIPSGLVALTNAGEALRIIIEPIKIDGYYDMVKRYMIKKGVKFANIDDYIIEEKDGEMTVTKKNNP